MCGSKTYGKSQLKKWFGTFPPQQRVLDVGCGMGNCHRWIHRRGRGDVWEAVEVWAPYVAEFSLDRMYETVYVMDIRNFSYLRSYDLVIFGDVLEHLPKADAIIVVSKAILHSRWVAISIPFAETKEWEEDPNPYHKHLHSWTLYEAMETWPSLSEVVPSGGKGVFTLRGAVECPSVS